MNTTTTTRSPRSTSHKSNPIPSGHARRQTPLPTAAPTGGAISPPSFLGHSNSSNTTTTATATTSSESRSTETTSSSNSTAFTRPSITTLPSDDSAKCQPAPLSSPSNAATKSSAASRSSGQETSAPRVVYGTGTVTRLPTELGRLHCASPLIVSSPSRIGLARRIQALIPNLDSRILDSAVVNVPARVVDDAVSRITGRDSVISIGGESAVGLAKAIGIRKSIPHICIPTTYSGSEMNPMLSDAKSASRKFGSRDPRTLPTVIIYDEDLTASHPKRFSAPSALDLLPQSPETHGRHSPRDDNAQWSYIHLPGV